MLHSNISNKLKKFEDEIVVGMPASKKVVMDYILIISYGII